MNAVLQALPLPPALSAAAMAQLVDSDLWGRLGALFEAHPDWSAQDCRTVLQEWVDARRRHPWQARLLRLWPRWKQHHLDLTHGLAQAGPLSWAQQCRFCEVWSANRPLMAPFCGVAQILLALPDLPDLPELPVMRPLAPPRQQCDVIVVSPDADLVRFAQFGASRQLLWVLQQCGLSWRLQQPWDGSLALDPATVRGVVFWGHRHRSHDFVHHAMLIERACAVRGIPVINSIVQGWDVRHSTILQQLRQAGLRCPQYQKFVDVDDITLPYPLILRVDGMHRGQHMHLVQDAGEARALERAARATFLMAGGAGVPPPPNLAIEYIDVADRQGRFHKYRAYVVGDQVLVRHRVSGAHWLVNFASSESVGGAGEGAGEPDIALLARAGRASGSDVTALDYSIAQDGQYVFWEANRLFKMHGDAGYGQPDACSESKLNRRAVADRKLGQCLLALLQERLVRAS